MTQATGTYTIENQGFAAFRTDLNTTLEWVLTLGASDTAPASLHSGMLWMDTGNDVLKIYNWGAANWIDIAEFDTGTQTTSLVGNVKRADASGNNITGETLYIDGGAGTGTGEGGQIILRVAPAGGSGGTGNNSLVDAVVVEQNGDIQVRGAIKHNGDLDTAIEFTDNQIGFKAGNDTILTLTSEGARIELQNGTASAPSLLFDSDTHTGFYRIADNHLGFSTGGVLRISMGSYGVRSEEGSQSSPSYSFVADPNTGMYRISEGIIGFSANGNEIFRIFQSGAKFSRPIITSANGSQSAPEIAFSGDTTTGIYQYGDGQIGFTCNGEFVCRMTDDNGYVDNSGGNTDFAYSRAILPNSSTTLGNATNYFEGAAIQRLYRNHEYTWSDIRYKSNVADLKIGLDAIMKITPIQYDFEEYKDEDDLIYGFSAQGLYEIPEFKHMVYKPENEETGVWNIRQDDIIPVLVNAVKELSGEIDTLKKQLSGEIDALKKQLDKLK